MGKPLLVSKTGSALREDESLSKIEELGRALGEVTFKLSLRGQAGMNKKERTGGRGREMGGIPSEAGSC